MVIQWTFFLAQWESQYPYVHHVTETLDFGWARNPGDSQEWRYCFFAPALKERSVPVPIYPNMEVSQNGVPHPSYHPWNKPSSSWGYLHFRKSQKKSNSHWGNLPKPLSVGKLGNSVPTCFIHPLPWYSIWVCSIIGFRKIPVSGWTSWKPPWPWYLNHKCWSKRPSFFILQPPFLTVKHVKPPFFHTSTSVFDGYPKKKHGCFNPPSSAAVPPRHSRARWPGRSSTFPLISRPKIRCVGMSRIQKTKVTIPLPREIRDENHGWDGFFDLPIIRFTKLGNLGWNSGDEKKRDLWHS